MSCYRTIIEFNRGGVYVQEIDRNNININGYFRNAVFDFWGSFLKEAPPQVLMDELGIIKYDPIDYTQLSWNTCMEQLAYDADAVFIGDSLFRGLNMQEAYPNKKCVNLGCSGDSIGDILKRCHVIKGFSPEKVFIEGGVNSLSDNSVNDVIAQYRQLLDAITSDNPDTIIYIHSVLPISKARETRRLTNANIVLLNIELEHLAKEYNITYIDIYSIYEDNGVMKPEYTMDGIHLIDSAKIYWIEYLRKYVE